MTAIHFDDLRAARPKHVQDSRIQALTSPEKSVGGAHPESRDPASVSILRSGVFARMGHVGKPRDSAGCGKVRSPMLVLTFQVTNRRCDRPISPGKPPRF